MDLLTTDMLSRACRIFADLAYPGGIDSVPLQRRFLLDMVSPLPALQFVAQTPAAATCCQVLSPRKNGPKVLAVRLGCQHYPHLKLRVQTCSGSGSEPSQIVFSVDTHDAFSAAHFFPPEGHPDANGWREIQAKNAALKQEIEAAWEKAGIPTFNGILRRGLEAT